MPYQACQLLLAQLGALFFDWGLDVVASYLQSLLKKAPLTVGDYVSTKIWDEPIEELMLSRCIGSCISLPMMRNNALMPPLSTLSAAVGRNGLFVYYEPTASRSERVMESIDKYQNAICSRNCTLYD